MALKKTHRHSRCRCSSAGRAGVRAEVDVSARRASVGIRLTALASSTGAAETLETARTLTRERMEANVNCMSKAVEELNDID